MIRTRSQSSCQLFCFRQCQNNYDELVFKKDMETPQKISLKKLSIIQVDKEEKSRMRKSSTNLKLSKIKSQTNRSKLSSDQQELNLFKKKAEIESEIDKLNSQMTQIADQYKSRLKMLVSVKNELDSCFRKSHD